MAGSSSDGDAVAGILAAGTLFGRLGLPDALVDGEALRRRYRQLALRVHPDKCAHSSAKEAFQRLSEAFDRLASEAGQREHLGMPAGSACAGGRGRQRQRQPGAAQAQEAHWWDAGTWEEFERRLRHREAAEAALQRAFASGLQARRAARRARRDALLAERAAEHCDRAARLPRSELWQSAVPFSDRPELDDAPSAVARLVRLLTHLRTVHRYCLYCGCAFESAEDLERNCPGFTAEDHDRAPGVAERTSAGASLEPAGQVEVLEEDPLDAFMRSQEAQLAQDLRPRKRKGGAERGWTFEQQQQQNKNALKMGRRR